MADRVYTKEQQEWRDEILGNRKAHIKSRQPVTKYIDPLDKMTESEKRIYYFNNCLWWLVEFRDGRTTKDRAIQAVNSLKQHIGTFPDLSSTNHQ